MTSEISQDGARPRHTGSLLKRLFAAIIDYALVAAITIVATYPFASSLDRRFRSGMGLYYVTTCAPGTALYLDGTPLQQTGWDGVTICDTKTDGLFPSRTAQFYRLTESSIGRVKTTYVTHVTIPLDGQNRVANVVDLSSWLVLLFVALAAWCEHRYGATPGKRLLHLAVVGEKQQSPSLPAACARNLLKYCLVCATAISSIGTAHFVLGLIQPDKTVVMPRFWPALMLALALLWIAQMILLLSIFVPWHRRGRALYDRIARTYVVTSGTTA